MIVEYYSALRCGRRRGNLMKCPGNGERQDVSASGGRCQDMSRIIYFTSRLCPHTRPPDCLLLLLLASPRIKAKNQTLTSLRVFLDVLDSSSHPDQAVFSRHHIHALGHTIESRFRREQRLYRDNAVRLLRTGQMIGLVDSKTIPPHQERIGSM
jgi:hypothetical protein